jgi:ribonuclease VapC
MKSPCVVDTSVVIAVLRGERGSETLERTMSGALISSLNYSEAIAVLMRSGPTVEVARTLVDDLLVTVVGFDALLAQDTAFLEGPTRAQGLSLADRACLALARRDKLPVLTADRAWRDLKLGVEIQLIR